MNSVVDYLYLKDDGRNVIVVFMDGQKTEYQICQISKNEKDLIKIKEDFGEEALYTFVPLRMEEDLIMIDKSGL